MGCCIAFKTMFLMRFVRQTSTKAWVKLQTINDKAKIKD
ncbi:hypothetical protein J2T04_000307 [Chryseobacterium lathyri]|uniref:Uncharacterized protein n=1 Tax=Chryseobacterium lathyri TaxID=395933 RepID=A0ABT9SJ20_9FLAO|nr:hypothetical protein [Chryseobacterium lathyri]MDQ0066474.1 hypothetical protein [Chryseobacterium lathyri]